MGEQVIIGIVVTVVLVAHGWLFIWVKFKIDEGTIMKILQETDDHTFFSSEEISSIANIAIDRVSAVCSKSKNIRGNAKENGSWHLN